MVPPAHKRVLKEAADRAGLPMVDYLALVVSRAHNLPDPEWIERRPAQDELEFPKESALTHQISA